MTKYDIAQVVANCHNRLASILESGHMHLSSADSVIMMGDTITELRSLVKQIASDLDKERDEHPENENEPKEM